MATIWRLADQAAARRRRRSLPPLLAAAAVCLLLWASSSSSSCCVVAAAAAPSPPIRAVNLGGWLVVEGWIKPSPFDTILSANELLQHWESFIVEEDFRFMSSRGLNAVRIPVAWWITMKEGSSRATSCNSPFYPGYLQMLDKAFDWASNYNSLGVIVDLHAAPGSQNGNDHSGSRDGSLLWASDANNIDLTVDAIGDLASRYGSRENLLAIELLNEPSAAVPLRTLGSYYAAGYRAVRDHTKDAYVIMSARLSGDDAPEIFGVIANGGYSKYAVDVHYYNLYDDRTFGPMTLDDIIRYVREKRRGDLAQMQRPPGGPPVIVGEWAAEWTTKTGARDGDYGKFARAQLDVFGNASFGWAYWTYRHDDAGDPGWSLKEMMKRGLVSFT